MAVQSYQHPGVYVQEVKTFPPSVAGVATAIPAFLGYTEKRPMPDPLKAIRITSLLEYGAVFGGAPPSGPIGVNGILPADNESAASVKFSNPASPPGPKFFLYFALKLYFDNGGGPCYVVSIGDYNATIRTDDFSAGLTSLDKEDEPTLVLAPDAVLALKQAADGAAPASPYDDTSEYFGICQKLLEHCRKRKDRFAILDVPNFDRTCLNKGIEQFRTQIVGDDMSYGAAYYPWLQTTLSLEYEPRDVKVSGFPERFLLSPTKWDPINNPQAVAFSLHDVDRVIKDDADAPAFELTSSRNVPKGTRSSLVAPLAQVEIAGTEEIYVIDKVEELDDWRTRITVKKPVNCPADDSQHGKGCVIWGPGVPFNRYSWRFWKVDASDQDTYTAARSKFGQPKNFYGVDRKKRNWIMPIGPVNWLQEYHDPVSTGLLKRTESLLWLYDLGEVPSQFTQLGSNASLGVEFSWQEMTLTDFQTKDTSVYSAVTAFLATQRVTLPPSAAMAGVFARVDRDRGVWKAPANVGLASVIAPALKITDAEQDGLNVDATSGKSINAIRSFAGRGTLVWGARTLAGNDNEWRYVNVRRLFILIEASIRKASAFAVFESNDATTWVRVQGMIESYLYGLWEQGALAGAKPEHAYFVHVGLGKTMTSQNILEGQLIVEVGVAAVRPAEFIILRFSHKLQES